MKSADIIVLTIIAVALALLLIGYVLKLLHALCARISHPVALRIVAGLGGCVRLYTRPLAPGSKIIRHLTPSDSETRHQDTSRRHALTGRHKLIRSFLLSLSLIPLGISAIVFVHEYFHPYLIPGVAPSVSPDGKYVVVPLVRRDVAFNAHQYLSSLYLFQNFVSSSLFIVKTGGDKSIKRVDLNYFPDQMVWSPNSDRFAAFQHSSPASAVRLYNPDNPETPKTFEWRFEGLGRGAWLNNSQYITETIQSTSSNHSLFVLDQITGQKNAIIKSLGFGQGIEAVLSGVIAVRNHDGNWPSRQEHVAVYLNQGIDIFDLRLFGLSGAVLGESKHVREWAIPVDSTGAVKGDRLAVIQRRYEGKEVQDVLCMLSPAGLTDLCDVLVPTSLLGWMADYHKIILLDRERNRLLAISDLTGEVREIADLTRWEHGETVWGKSYNLYNFSQLFGQGWIFLDGLEPTKGGTSVAIVDRTGKSKSIRKIPLERSATLLSPTLMMSWPRTVLDTDHLNIELHDLNRNRMINLQTFPLSTTIDASGRLLFMTYKHFDQTRLQIFNPDTWRLEDTINLLEGQRTVFPARPELYAGFTALLLTLGLGTLVYLRHPEGSTHRVFYLFNLTLATVFLVPLSGTYLLLPTFLAWWVTIPVFCICLLPALFMHLFLVFPERPKAAASWTNVLTWKPLWNKATLKGQITDRMLWSTKWMIYMPSLILFVVMLGSGRLPVSSDYSVVSLLVQTRNSLGITAAYAFVLLGGYILLTMVSLVRFYFRTTEQIRRQITFIVFGAIASILLSALIPVIQMFWTGTVTPSMLRLLLFPLLLIPLTCGYAILKHRMLDVELIIRKGLLYSALTLLLGGTAVGLILLVTSLFQGLVASTDPLVVTPITLGIAATFIPVRNRVQLLIDRRFFREKIDYRVTFSRLANQLPSVRDFEAVTRHLVDTVDTTLHLNRTLLLQPAADGAFQVAYATPERSDTGAITLPAGHPFLTRLETQDALLYIADDRVARSLPAEAVQQAEAWGLELFIALRTQDRLIGVLALGPKRSELPFSTDDRELLSSLAGPAALALENARLYAEAVDSERLSLELEVAHQMQVSLLPVAMPVVEGYELAGLCHPAAEVGGDHYGFHWLDADHTKLAILVADVSGKQMQAAMTMMRLAELLYYETQRHTEAAALLSGLNRAMVGRFGRRTFVTACVAVLDLRAHTVSVANAGHPPAFCVAIEGVVEEIDVTGYPLGWKRDVVYEAKTVILAAGDTLVLHTDGLYEALGSAGEQYGFGRMAQTLSGLAGAEVSVVCTRLMAAVDAYTGGGAPEDDRTVVVVRRE